MKSSDECVVTPLLKKLLYWVGGRFPASVHFGVAESAPNRGRHGVRAEAGFVGIPPGRIFSLAKHLARANASNNSGLGHGSISSLSKGLEYTVFLSSPFDAFASAAQKLGRFALVAVRLS